MGAVFVRLTVALSVSCTGWKYYSSFFQVISSIVSTWAIYPKWSVLLVMLTTNEITAATCSGYRIGEIIPRGREFPSGRLSPDLGEKKERRKKREERRI